MCWPRIGHAGSGTSRRRRRRSSCGWSRPGVGWRSPGVGLLRPEGVVTVDWHRIARITAPRRDAVVIELSADGLAKVRPQQGRRLGQLVPSAGWSVGDQGQHSERKSATAWGPSGAPAQARGLAAGHGAERRPCA